MWDKRRYATHVVSNLTFDPDRSGAWVDRMRGRGITMPMLLGIPGPVDRAKLLSMADQDRRRRLHPLPGQAQGHLRPARRARRLHRRAVPASSAPPVLARAGARWSTGLHVYTFNQVAETEAWRRDYLDRLMRLSRPAIAGDGG